MTPTRPHNRWLQALPMGVAMVLLASVSQTPVPSAVMAVLAVMGCVLGGRVDVTPVTQAVVGALVAAAGGVAMSTLAPTGDAPGRADRFWSVVAAAALAGAVTRLAVRTPAGGARGTVALGFVAVAACGEVKVLLPYGACVGLWLVTALLALRADDPARGPWLAVTRRTWVTVGTMALVTLGVAAGLARALPPLHARAVEMILGRISPTDAVTGFTDSLELSGLDGMLQSDTVVLRVYGPAEDYLRGAVYDRYDRTGWRSTHAAEVRPLTTMLPPLGGDRVVEVRRVGGLAGRYFLPLGVRDLTTPGGRAVFDPLGIVHVNPGDPGDVVWYRPGERTGPVSPIEPADQDLRVPADVRAALTPLVLSWTEGATGPAHVMASLTSHLRREYHYALSTPAAPRHVDPVVYFLLHSRRGHCEYFASALALTARIAGVHTRVVGGYRVSERNDFGGYLVVRERNAHTWVEAWQPGHGWQTEDGTPGGGEPRVQGAGTWRSFTDFTAALVDAAGAWLSRRRPVDLLATAAAAAALLGVIRWARVRRRETLAETDDHDPPWPAWVTLARALAQAGVPRTRGETLETYARRVAGALSLPPDDVTVQAIGAYAAHRYGAVGERSGVEQGLVQAARAVAGRRPPVTSQTQVPSPPDGEYPHRP